MDRICSVKLQFPEFLYLVIVSSISQQSAESDGIGDTPQVDEEHSWDGLDVKTLVEITWQPRQFPLYVQVQAPTEAIVHVHMQQLGCVC